MALGAHLRLLFVKAERGYHANVLPTKTPHSIGLVREFQLAMEEHILKIQTVGEYAALLHVSPDRLSEVVREAMGHPAGEMIRQRQLLEARRLLAHTTRSVSEIAYALNSGIPRISAGFPPSHRPVAGRIPGGLSG